MKTLIDLEKWNRSEHFHFFAAFDDPFFGITTNLDVTSLYHEVKKDKASFFLYSLHKIMRAVNKIEEFRYRIEDGKVVCFDTIHTGTTIGREDGTFGFGFIEYATDRDEFVRKGKLEIKRIQSLSGLCYGDSERRTDIIRFSPVPWIKFTEQKHAVSFKNGDSVPRISTGKLTEENGRWMLPISLTAHHGLMDGRHVADLLKWLEETE